MQPPNPTDRSKIVSKELADCVLVPQVYNARRFGVKVNGTTGDVE